MKEKQEKRINSELFGAAAKKTLEIGKKAVGGVQSGVNVVAEKSKKAASDVRVGVSTAIEKQKQDNIQHRIKKLNPLFPDKYFSEEFHIPNVIIIVDDAVRRDNELCEGAIGWLSNDSGTETLYMYDEFVAQSGITFVPSATCNSAYYVDNFERGRLYSVDEKGGISIIDDGWGLSNGIAFSPDNTISPSDGVIIPHNNFANVDFPAPFSPTSKFSPFAEKEKDAF